MTRDIAERIADETRKRIMERDHYPAIMQEIALDAIVSDLADQIRAAVAASPRAGGPTRHQEST